MRGAAFAERQPRRNALIEAAELGAIAATERGRGHVEQARGGIGVPHQASEIGGGGGGLIEIAQRSLGLGEGALVERAPSRRNTKTTAASPGTYSAPPDRIASS